MGYDDLIEQMIEIYFKIEEIRNQEIPRAAQRSMVFYLNNVQDGLNIFRNINTEYGGNLSDDLLKETQELMINAQSIVDELNDSFLLFLVGMGNYGKSTLLNALVESEVADMDFLPKTWKIDVYYKNTGDQKPTVHYRDGRIKALTETHIKLMLQYEEKKRIDSEKEINAIFKIEAQKFSRIEEKEELKKYLNKEKLYQSDITEVRWPLRETSLLNKFRLVDTPGLNQQLLGETQIRLKEYYHKADGVLWMLDATKISSAKGKEMIKELQEYISEIGGKTDNIIGVINFADRIRKKQGEEGIVRVTNEAKKIFKGYFLDTVCVSAKDALEASLSNNSKKIKESGINELLMAVDRYFYARSQDIQIQKKGEGVEAIFNDMGKFIKAYISKIKKDEEKRCKIKAAFEAEINKKYEQYLNNFNLFIESYVSSAKKNIDDHLEGYIESNKSQEYIQEQLFNSESLSKDIQNRYIQMLQDFEKTKSFYFKESQFKEYQYINSIKNNYHDTIKDSFISMNLHTNNAEAVYSIGIAFVGATILGPIGLILGGIAKAVGISKYIDVKWKTHKLKRKLYAKLSECEEGTYRISENVK